MRGRVRASAILLGTVLSAPALAQEEPPAPSPEPNAGAPAALAEPRAAEPPPDLADHAGYMPGYRRVPSLGLAPYVPPVPELPGGTTSSFGSPVPSKGWNFDFHGYISAGTGTGINHRQYPAGAGQHDTVLHTPPEVPAPWGTFGFTGTVPGTWGQLNFLYGNENVTATVIVAGWRVSRPEGYYLPAGHLGINDAFLTFKVPIDKLRLDWNVGAFGNRYGAMGEWSEGQYGTSLIASLTGIGETLTASYELSKDYVLQIEHGFKGKVNAVPQGVAPGDPSLGWAYPQQGSTWVNHLHLGFGYRDTVQAGLHYARGFSQDDRPDPADVPTTAVNETQQRPDGYETVLGADFRLRAGPFGFLFLGVSHVDAHHVQSMQPGVLAVLNMATRDLSNVLGPLDLKSADDDISGSLTNIGLEYDVSLGALLRYPKPKTGDTPDIRLSLFGIQQFVKSKIPEFNNDKRLKIGTEISYTLLPWLSVSGRFDRVMPELDDMAYAWTILSPRLIFRTNWSSREQVYIQYARWIYGDKVTRLTRPADQLDRDMIAISGSVGW